MSKTSEIISCEFCKAQVRADLPCPNCGAMACFMDLDLIYGRNLEEKAGVRLILTDKYLIFRRREMVESAGSLGLSRTGVRAGQKAQDAARAMGYAFYDLKEVAFVQHPYNGGEKNDSHFFRLVMADGSDICLYVPWILYGALRHGKTLRLLEDSIRKVGLGMEKGEGPGFCQKPLANRENYAGLVAASAAKFVPLGPWQVAGRPLSPEEPKPQPAVEKSIKWVCPSCGPGAPVIPGGKFCPKCGSKLIEE